MSHMKKVIFTILFLPPIIIGCDPAVPVHSFVQIYINGQLRPNDNQKESTFVFSYSSGKLTIYEANFFANSTTIGVGNSNQNLTDSIILNNTYGSSQNWGPQISLWDVQSLGNNNSVILSSPSGTVSPYLFNFTVTERTQNSISGTFYGIMQGINSVSGAKVTDTIRGSFNEVPIFRIFN